MITVAKFTRWQFSIRSTLIAMTLLGILMAVVAMFGRKVLEQRFVNSAVVPITETYVSSVGYANGQIVWLRANNVSPHHPNHFDEWIVPIAMDVASNDGAVGKYKSFGDPELRDFVAEHPYLRALDVRDSQVTYDGLVHLAKLKQLEWLWLDASQATDSALVSIEGLSSLRMVWLPLAKLDSAVVDRLRQAMPNCKFADSDLLVEGAADRQESLQ